MSHLSGPAGLAMPVTDAALADRLRERMTAVEEALSGHVRSRAGFVSEAASHLMEAGGESFPSGHSFNAAVVYIAMALAFASMSSRHSVRYTIVGSAMVLSAMIAWSRVMLGVHFPSDVTAGWLGGAGWAFLAAALLYEPAKAAADRQVAGTLDPATAAHSGHSATQR